MSAFERPGRRGAPTASVPSHRCSKAADRGLVGRHPGDDGDRDRWRASLPVPHLRSGVRRYLTTSTGTSQCTSTRVVSLPSNSALTPRRPCEAITIRSHACVLA